MHGNSTAKQRLKLIMKEITNLSFFTKRLKSNNIILNLESKNNIIIHIIVANIDVTNKVFDRKTYRFKGSL